MAYHHSDSDTASSSRRGPSPAFRSVANYHRATALATVTSVFALLLAACGNTSSTKTSSPAPAALSAPAASTKSVSAITVVIRNYGYLPANFTVAPGATVTVRNEDRAPHTLTSDNLFTADSQVTFNTGDVPQGIPKAFQAPTRPGRYPFHCLYHPYMTGVLTVF
jgi:plastocyanin